MVRLLPTGACSAPCWAPRSLKRLHGYNDQMFTRLFGSTNFNRTPEEVQLGVPGNLVAFACKLLFAKGSGGYILFESKTMLLVLYQKMLGAHTLSRSVMAVDPEAAKKLINRHFL